MKYLPLFILPIIIFSTSCKKDKVESIKNTANTNPLQYLNGKTLEFNSHWRRDSLEREIFCIADGNSGKVDSFIPTYLLNYDSLKTSNMLFSYKINVVSPDSIEVVMVSGNSGTNYPFRGFNGLFTLTSFNANSDYYVFYQSDNNYSAISDSINRDDYINYIKGGSYANFKSLGQNAMPTYFEDASLLFIPKNIQLPSYFVGNYSVLVVSEPPRSMDSTAINYYKIPTYFQVGYSDFRIDLDFSYSNVYSEGGCK